MVVPGAWYFLSPPHSHRGNVSTSSGKINFVVESVATSIARRGVTRATAQLPTRYRICLTLLHGAK